MMNKIYADLEQNVISIYKDNIITINKYLHHSLNYEEVQILITKYKGDIKKLKVDLHEAIVQYEVDKKKKTEVKTQRHQNSKDPHFDILNDFFNVNHDDFFRNSFEDRLALDPKQVYVANDLKQIFKFAEQFEVNKLNRQAQETGQVPSPADISFGSFLRALIEVSKTNQPYSYLYKIIKDSKFDIEKFIKDENLGKAQNKPIIDELCTNLNNKAKEGKLQTVIGRESEIDQLINILNKARKNNPILVGKAGTGKTAIVEGLAKRIVEGNVPNGLKNAIIYNLEIVNIVKGTSFRGQFEQKMSDLLAEFKDIEESGKMPILFIDELHTIMGAGSSGQGGLDFSNIIKPALARGELRTIGATTTDEWHKFIKENSALDRRFVSVSVKEPDFDTTLKIVSESLKFYEDQHDVKYDKGTVERAIELAQQFVVDNANPDKTFDLIDFAGARSNVQGKKKVTVEDIEFSLATHKNIDLNAILESKRHNIERIAPKIKKVIFGQDQAVEKVSKVIEKAIAKMNNPLKPYGAFLFTGPTGTGKTELAKQVAKYMNANFHRIDCSALKEAHSISKLLGSPAGYVGYDDGSSLTKIINENPRTVILFDEIEKAHPDIYNLLLQVMDYGSLTDSKGKEINFRNVVLIMTSNAGVQERERHTIGLQSDNVVKQKRNLEVESIFKPEFRARLTGNAPIEFNPMTKLLLEKIVHKELDEIVQQRLIQKNITLDVSPDVIDLIVSHGLQINLGARPVKEYIEDKIIEPITEELLFGKYKNLTKMTRIKIELQNGQIVI